jgi:(p)ppGpp synthase/HD superfamily hydrolase
MTSKTREGVEAFLAHLGGRPWSTDLAQEIARLAHTGVVDKIGQAYIDHPAAVVALVAAHGDEAQQVAWLHDVVEDTGWTLEGLRAAGAPDAVISGVDAMTKRAGETREQTVRRAASDPLGFVVKPADVAHNASPTRNAQIEDQENRERLAAKYANDRILLDSLGAPRYDVL